MRCIDCGELCADGNLPQIIACVAIASVLRMSVSHLCRTAARVVGSKALKVAVKPSFPTLQIRTFATTYKDLPYMVGYESEDDDPSHISVNVLKDEVRQEMYLKYMEDQEKWSFENLSVAYGSSLIRTKAVIYLMQKRHELISEDEDRLYELLEMKNPKHDENSTLSKFRVQPKLTPPEPLVSLFAKHREDDTVPLSVLIAAYNENVSPEGPPDGKPVLILSEQNLAEAIKIMRKHATRALNVKAHTENEAMDIEECREAGLNVQFKEASTTYSTNKAFNVTHYPSEHRNKSFEDNYYPPLVGDSAVKRHEFNLLKRVEHETKAQLEHDMEYYERVYSIKTPEEAVEEIKSSPLPPALQFHQPPAADAPVGRWKIAFQDLSTSAVPKTKTTIRVPDRTVIRTRKGELRYATPLEEGQRSWRVRPDGIDTGLALGIPHNHARMVAPYLDVDKDEAASAQRVNERRERRKALRVEAGVVRK